MPEMHACNFLKSKNFKKGRAFLKIYNRVAISIAIASARCQNDF